MTQNRTGDHLVVASAFGGRVRGVAADTTLLCRDMVRLHGLAPLPAAALGRFATGMLLMATDLKNPGDSVTGSIRSDGPLRGMTVVAEPDATVRGYAWEPVVETRFKESGKLDVSWAVGAGTLTVIRDTGRAEPYIGRVALVSGEIAEDLAAYYAQSEQIPTAMGLGVRMDRDGVLQAGGFRIQLMQGADDALAEKMQRRAAGYPEVTWLLQEGFSPEQMLDMLFGDPDYVVHERKPCAYHCPCNRDRMRRGLIALGRAGLEELLDSPDPTELTCHFCNEKYHFSNDEIRSMMNEI